MEVSRVVVVGMTARAAVEVATAPEPLEAMKKTLPREI